MADIQETIEQDELNAIGPALPAKQQKANVFENGKQLEYEIINGIPCYQAEHVIDGIVEVFERIGYDDKVGATFLGIAPDGKELVIRVAPADKAAAHAVRVEAAFLCKVEAEKNDWRHFSQVHKIFQTDDALHMTLYFRGGPTLEQCFQLRDDKFTMGTAGRLAHDVLSIIQCAHKHGYLVRNVNLDCFHYDAASRHLFMADISSLVKDLSKTDLKIAEPVAAYIGRLDFAPLVVHNEDGRILSRQDIESWFYMFVYMVKGLAWEATSFAETGRLKQEGVSSGSLYEGLPSQFEQIAKIIFTKDVYAKVTDEEYAKLLSLTEQIYRDVGGVADHDENMDFEREPTAEEIPRLVYCPDDQVENLENIEEEDENDDEDGEDN